MDRQGGPEERVGSWRRWGILGTLGGSLLGSLERWGALSEGMGIPTGVLAERGNVGGVPGEVWGCKVQFWGAVPAAAC